MVRGNDYTGPRPHVQGSAAALRVAGAAGGSPTRAASSWFGSCGRAGAGRLDRPAERERPRPLPAIAHGRVVGGAAPVRRRGDGRPAASGAAGRAPHLRLGAGAAPGHVRALVAGFGGRAVAASGRAVVADGAAALGAGRRGAPVGDDRHGLDRRGALRAEAGRGGAGLQPEEAGPPLAPPPSGLRPGDGRLPRGALAAGGRAHGPGGGGVAGRAGGPPEGGGGAADHRAAGQGVLLQVHRAAHGGARRVLSAQGAAARLARRLPGRLGDRRPGRGRGPGAEDGLRRAVGDQASLGREAETGRAGGGRTRSRGVGDHDERRRSDQHREHRPRRGVARLQRGARSSSSGSRSWASSRPAAPRWTTSAATPCRGASPCSPTNSSTSRARTSSAAAGAPCSRAASGCACCAPPPG